MKLIWKSVKWGLLTLVRRPIYLFAIILVPLLGTYFFLDLLDEGLPTRVPTAVVDLDQTNLSRKLVRNLGELQMVDIKYKYNSFTEAREAVQRGDIFAFFVVPRNFAKDVLSARQPQISYYNNYVYYIPATLSYKNYKTEATLTSGAVIANAMSSLGVPKTLYMPKIAPYQIHVHGLNNPWTSYNIYLSNSFAPCMLALMILIITCYTLGIEVKKNRSIQWLKNSNNSIALAVFGKLFPQTVIFWAVGLLMQSMLYGYYHFPLNSSPWHMISAMMLLVVASQSFALFVYCIVPNLRISLSIMSLMGILSFSIAGFSFPVEQMYGGIGIFSYILPIRYYFLIYIDQALNGIPLYYSRFYYIALLIFTLLPLTMLWRLKRASLNPVYIP